MYMYQYRYHLYFGIVNVICENLNFIKECASELKFGREKPIIAVLNRRGPFSFLNTADCVLYTYKLNGRLIVAVVIFKQSISLVEILKRTFHFPYNLLCPERRPTVFDTFKISLNNLLAPDRRFSATCSQVHHHFC